MEDSVAEMARRGAKMSDNGLRLLSPVPSDRLSAAELKLRESESPNPRRWLPFAGSPVRCHPISGRPGIWTNPMHLEGYLGMTEEASRALLEQIMLPSIEVGAGDIAANCYRQLHYVRKSLVIFF